jgi:hypothetical protein
MSKCHFIHDFFEDGRADAIAEVRMLQDLGLWTKQKRASWTKKAVSTSQHLKHDSSRKEGISYFAGRTAALKSRLTADCSPEHTPTPVQARDPIIYRPLSHSVSRFCGFFDCCETAIWGVCLWEDKQPFLLLCDPCRQEWMRTETAYVTPDGWDWDEEECDMAKEDEPAWERAISWLPNKAEHLFRQMLGHRAEKG